MALADDLWQTLRPRVASLFSDERQRATFLGRCDARFASLTELLWGLYGDRADFAVQLEAMLRTTAEAFIVRPPALHALDAGRSVNWFQHERMVGGICYVDRYAANLAGIRARIPYFLELGLTYLHLMPLFRSPPIFNDGGYAVSSFREVRSDLGTMAELAELAAALRANGISLVLDFVMNHTADDHEWALRARAGDPEYQAYYRLFADQTVPQRYELTLREIFPDQAPGNFTYVPELQQWAWTTFQPYQWDLNYAHPALFNAMLGEMLFLANQGVEVLRLDAVAFIWKAMGTSCENLPQAHEVVAAFNILAQLAAPTMIFKSEAIVHPDEVVKYMGRECEISYNPLLMVLLWEALATGNTQLLQHSMAKRFQIPPNAAWVNYLRSHDDIGWGFANEDCAEIGIDGADLRTQLNAFFTGQAPGSFASGIPFGYNPRTGDMRICGTTASLAGLEKALYADDAQAIDLAIRRILAMWGLILAVGGIPLLYLGDEVGTLNDYRYLHDATKATDSRWVHRPGADAKVLLQRYDPTSIAGRIFGALQAMIRLRKSSPIFAADQLTSWLDCGNAQLVVCTRHYEQQRIAIVVNFSDQQQSLQLDAIMTMPLATDLLTQTTYTRATHLQLAPYAVVWLHEQL